jgi:hypothetical protein
MTNKLVSRFIISTFVTLYALVSVISTIHVIDFFELSNPYWLAVTLAIGFELGAAASLASLVILKKMNKTLVWALFITITLMQMQGNMYYAFINLEDFQSWSELFNLIEEEPIFQKRVLAAVSGAILPLVALGFIKSLVDYIKPEEDDELVSDDVAEFDDVSREVSSDYFEDGEDLYWPKDEEVEEDPIEDDWEDEEDWDEEHALDQVLNDMASEIEVDEEVVEAPEEDEMDVWGVTLEDGLDDLEDYLEEDFAANDAEPETEEVEDELIDDDELAFQKAMEARAEQAKNNYLKNNENAES